MAKSMTGVHGHALRGDQPPPTGVSFRAGRFGRMVPELATPLVPPDEALVELGLAMVDDNAPPGAGNNENLPAGFTYLGQFIDHDITLDTTTLTETAQDPEELENFRTPRLDLDSIYGLGPRVQPSLYDRHSPGRAKLLVGGTSLGRNGQVKAGLPHDLPRNPQGFAIIGDERNDENLLVAQTHLAFLRFHNRMVDHLVGTVSDDDLFDAVRRAVVDLYQAMVIRDFLPRICGPNAVAAAIENRRFFRFETLGKYGQPYMPVEFSAAAYRLGHSMVRNGYNHNRLFPGAGFNLFFRFTAKSGLIGTPEGTPTFPSDWIIDWRRFFDFHTEDTEGDFSLNLSRTIDPYLAPALHRLPGKGGKPLVADDQPPSPDGSLAVMNLRRGVKMKLPAAQDLARFMGIEPLSPTAIESSGKDGEAAAKHGLHERTPLWYYILKEAQLEQGGQRLGALGSTIVAETLIGLMQGDPASLLCRDRTWRFGQPVKGLALPGAESRFDMTDLLKFAAGVPNGADEATLKRLLSPIDDLASTTSALVLDETEEAAPKAP